MSREHLARWKPQNAGVPFETGREVHRMQHRDLASIVALTTLALTVGVGCPEDPKPTPPKPAAAIPAKPATTTPTTTTAATVAAAAGKDGPLGTATLKGTVNFSGKALEMKVPKKRKDAEFCKTKDVKYN